MNALKEENLSIGSDRLLLLLSLELSVAQENLAAVEAFGRYLRARFSPAVQTQREPERNSEEAAKLSGAPSFTAADADYTFVIPFPLPVVFSLESCAGAPPTGEEIGFLDQLSRAFRLRMEATAELKGLTYTDDLTGLYNQRYLELVLDREMSLAKRNSTTFSVLFLDLDHFKAVNDTHGHLIGSRLLFEVGQEIKKALRESDICFRYGGDEFVVILSHTGLDDAVVVAERIRVQIEKKRFLAREEMDIRLTTSIGVASVPDHAVTKQQILKVADEALYGVKKAVRNRVIAASAVVKE